MALFLGIAAGCAFGFHPLAAAMLLRCGLVAGLRFSPRAAMALSALASLSACATAMLHRGRISWPRSGWVPSAAFAGGTLGRALLLMLTSRFTGSLMLLRTQAIPLLLLCLPVWFPATPVRRRSVLTPNLCAALAFVCGLIEGFYGAGGLPLYIRFSPTTIRRRALPTLALCVPLFAQAGALALTLACNASQVFPSRMLVMVLLGAALGSLTSEKRRGMPSSQGHAALNILLLLLALAGLEHAYLPI